ncbi:MAG: hypothetical protein IJW12_07190, partial [Opitutales bacterium]|nr:hypothetical protein [Opitutales bacterium]
MPQVPCHCADKVGALNFNLRGAAGTRRIGTMLPSSQKGFSGAARWAVYDLGHTAFSMLVLAVMFPILFNDYWSASLPEPS